MSYVGGQYGVPRAGTTNNRSDNVSRSSDSDFGLAMPQGYQVKTSPNRRSPASEQRLVMLAKHPNATNGGVQQAIDRRGMRQPRPGQHVSFQTQPPQTHQPVRVAHTGIRHSPQDRLHQQQEQRAQVQQGGYTDEWEETPPPQVEYSNAVPKKRSFFGRFISRILPSGQDNQSLDDMSRDNSYAKSYASETTHKISNIDEKAKQKRLRKEARLAANAERKSCFGCIFRNRVAMIVSACFAALILGGILSAGAAYAAGAFEADEPSLNNFDDVETWIPRPQDSSDDEDTSFPTSSPTSVGGGTGRIPTNPPTQLPSLPPAVRPATPAPTVGPTPRPTPSPTTKMPTRNPSRRPTMTPTRMPTSNTPTRRPTLRPTERPTVSPSTSMPSMAPTKEPTASPTYALKELEKLGPVLSGSESGQRFGYAVALSEDGNVLAVGVPFANTFNGASTQTQSGQVQVYQWNNNQWEERGVPLTGRNSQDKFGSAVALSADGRMLVVSEPTYVGVAGDRSGNVRTFIYDGSANQYITLGRELEGVAATDHFGISLALSKNGDRLAVGAPYHDNSIDNTRQVSGQVRTFRFANNRWVPLGTPLGGESHFDWFGWKVDFNDDGSVMCVGAPRNLEFGGYVTCYEFVVDDWEIMGGRIRNTIDPLRYDDNFGHTLSVNGRRVAIGSPGKNDRTLDSGLVAIFEYNDVERIWTRLGNAITSIDPKQGEQLGFAVDLRGSTLAVSIPGKNNRGQVDFYYYNSGTNSWDVNPNPLVGASGSNFGFSVHMTSRVAVGSAVSDGINAGLVDVYYQP